MKRQCWQQQSMCNDDAGATILETTQKRQQRCQPIIFGLLSWRRHQMTKSPLATKIKNQRKHDFNNTQQGSTTNTAACTIDSAQHVIAVLHAHPLVEGDTRCNLHVNRLLQLLSSEESSILFLDHLCSLTMGNNIDCCPLSKSLEGADHGWIE